MRAGVLLALDSLHPSSQGARVKFSGKSRTVIDGPFTETKEILHKERLRAQLPYQTAEK
jgi:hypothetical protein